MGTFFNLAVRGGRVVGEWEREGWVPPTVQPADPILKVTLETRYALEPHRGDDGLLPDPRTVGLPLILQLAPLDFFALFTADEFAAVSAAAVASPALLVWLLRAAGAQYIDLHDSLTDEGLSALVAAGLLTEARKAEILAGSKPEEGA